MKHQCAHQEIYRRLGEIDSDSNRGRKYEKHARISENRHRLSCGNLNEISLIFARRERGEASEMELRWRRRGEKYRASQQKIYGE